MQPNARRSTRRRIYTEKISLGRAHAAASAVLVGGLMITICDGIYKHFPFVLQRRSFMVRWSIRKEAPTEPREGFSYWYRRALFTHKKWYIAIFVEIF